MRRTEEMKQKFSNYIIIMLNSDCKLDGNTLLI